MNETIISSQRYTDDATVEAKRAARDYVVTIGKPIEVDGETYRVVIDGHHSMAAAIADGVDPVYVVASAIDCDREAIDDVDDYLDAHYIDDDWYDVATGVCVWA